MTVIIKNNGSSTLVTLPDNNPVSDLNVVITPDESMESVKAQVSIDLDAMTVAVIVDADGVTYTASDNLQ